MFESSCWWERHFPPSSLVFSCSVLSLRWLWRHYYIARTCVSFSDSLSGLHNLQQHKVKIICGSHSSCSGQGHTVAAITSDFRSHFEKKERFDVYWWRVRKQSHCQNEEKQPVSVKFPNTNCYLVCMFERGFSLLFLFLMSEKWYLMEWGRQGLAENGFNSLTLSKTTHICIYLSYICYEHRLRELGLFHPEKTRPQRDLSAVFQWDEILEKGWRGIFHEAVWQ